MASWTDTLVCGYCGGDLPRSGWKWRNVWSDRLHRYRRKRVHEQCATRLDELGTATQLFASGRRDAA